MQTHYRINQHQELLLFFTGWGMDEHPCEMLGSRKFDICTCYHYHPPELPDPEMISGYSSITVVAWSMGVWAAEQVLRDTALPVIKKIAVNGSPFPVHDQFGIPVNTAMNTCNTLTPETLRKFYRRMFGGDTLLRQMEPYLPVIDLEARKEELRSIILHADGKPSMNWDKVILSTEDAIFPSHNLRQYWTGKAPLQEIKAPHYPFHLYPDWEALIDD